MTVAVGVKGLTAGVTVAFWVTTVQMFSFKLLKSFRLKAGSTWRRYWSGATVIHGLEALVL